MLQQVAIQIRTECPPGACVCERERLLAEPGADIRPLRLTRSEELRLLERIEQVANYEQLRKLQAAIERNLGAPLIIEPGPNEVRTVRGMLVRLTGPGQNRGLCRKTRQAVAAAVRRCLERHPEIVYAILDAHDLFGGPGLR